MYFVFFTTLSFVLTVFQPVLSFFINVQLIFQLKMNETHESGSDFLVSFGSGRQLASALFQIFQKQKWLPRIFVFISRTRWRKFNLIIEKHFLFSIIPHRFRFYFMGGSFGCVQKFPKSWTERDLYGWRGLKSREHSFHIFMRFERLCESIKAGQGCRRCWKDGWSEKKGPNSYITKGKPSRRLANIKNVDLMSVDGSNFSVLR